MSILSKFGATWTADEIASWSSNTSVQKSGGILAAVLLFFVSYRRYFNRISRWNLPGPSQSILPIDIFDRTPNKYELHLLLDSYVRKYGSIFAFYHQGHPVITVSDEKLIHKILWDKDHSFENRKFFINLPWPCHRMVTMEKGENAKFIRSLLKNVLDAKSIKDSWSHFKEVNDTVETVLLEASMSETQEVDSTSLAHGYVMQVILKVAFSLDYANQSNSNNLLVSCSQDFVRTPLWIQRFSEVPILRGFIKYLPWGFKSRLAPFLSTAAEIVSTRRKCENQTPQDILDVLLMAQKTNKNVTDEILIAQAIVMLTVVHASTSTTIAIATYFIAKYKHIQDKLQEEIDQISSLDDFPSYEHIHKQLPYLNQVINEVLRLYPSAFMIMRECTKPTTIDNIHFDKGDGVLIPTYSIHRNSSVYKDPEVYDPSRFENKKPGHYYPFGDGYRMCPGKMMALSEIKMYFAFLLKNFDITLADEKQELKTKSYLTVQTVMLVEEPIKIVVEKRMK